MKVNQKIVDRAQRAVDDGEVVDKMALVMKGSKAALFLGPIGVMFLTNLWVVKTDRHLYVMEPEKNDMEIQSKHPLGEIEVTARKGFPVGAIEIGPETLWLAFGQQREGLEIADAAAKPATST